MKFSKSNRRGRIRHRIRNKISGSDLKPRLSVFRSNRYIYCQLIDDIHGRTLLQASSLENDISKAGSKIEQAKQVGKLLAEKAKQIKIDSVTFDRGGYLYHGRVKSLAEGAREGGINF